MNEVQNTYTKPEKFRLLVWDYDIKPQEFFAILQGQKEKGWFTKEWAMARVLEHLNYYDAMALIPKSQLRKSWKEVKRKIYSKTIRDGYEFVLRRHTLSTAR